MIENNLGTMGGAASKPSLRLVRSSLSDRRFFWGTCTSIPPTGEMTGALQARSPLFRAPALVRYHRRSGPLGMAGEESCVRLPDSELSRIMRSNLHKHVRENYGSFLCSSNSISNDDDYMKPLESHITSRPG